MTKAAHLVLSSNH